MRSTVQLGMLATTSRVLRSWHWYIPWMDTIIAQTNWTTLAAGWLGGLATLYAGQALTKRGNRKLLTWEFAIGALANVDGTFRSDVEILFNNKKIEDAKAICITVKNSGPKHIDESDFKEDFKLTIPGADAVLQLRVSVASGKVVQPKISTLPNNAEPTSVYIKPLLLNPGEQFTLFALVSGYKDNVDLVARIAGGSLVRKTTGTIEIEPIRAFATAASMFAMFAGFAVFAGHADGLHRGIGTYAAAAVFSLIFGFWFESKGAAKR